MSGGKPARIERHSYVSRSPEETVALGRKLVGRLPPPKTIVLRGDLGAGKTTLVKGIAAALGAAEPEEVTSPTFTLIHEYAGRRADRSDLSGNTGETVLLYHLDLYRIETQQQLDTLGIEELATPESLVLIEWGEKFPSLAGQSDGEVTIEILPEEKRRITLSLHPQTKNP
jgi:tRNA threonylcarbamoyladenosine biosynthesis protein TsaE